MHRALFLDRDGTLIEEVGPLTRPEQVNLLPGVVGALRLAADAGLRVVVVTNQPVVARGWCGEADVDRVHKRVSELIVEAGARPPERFYVCPHHPHADLPEYRLRCACRKPEPGLLHRAAADLDLDLRASFMVGDRASDIVAGRRAGCTTCLVETGAHREPPIVGLASDQDVRPDHRCADLATALCALVGGRA